jgi:hypothetical protein
MPDAFEPETDFALSEQTSIEPVQRFSLIVAAMLFCPPGIIAQWFVTMIAMAISPAPMTTAMFCPMQRICPPTHPFSTPEVCHNRTGGRLRPDAAGDAPLSPRDHKAQPVDNMSNRNSARLPLYLAAGRVLSNPPIIVVP